MVSATNNANDAAPADDPFGVGMHVGARDQLAYYSSYGSRVDLAAPGGARRFNLPGWDGGDGNILYGGWGSLGALAENGVICRDPLQSSLFNFACFKVDGAGFGWLQGTSMSAPNALGVAALVISAKPVLRHDPDDLVARLEATARRTMTNYTGPSDPSDTVFERLEAPALPSSLLIDKHGVVRDVWVGYDPGQVVATAQRIQALLAEP